MAPVLPVPDKKMAAGRKHNPPARILAGLILAAVLGLVVPAQASVGPRLVAGCRLLGWGQLDEAEQEFEAASWEDSRCAEAQAGLGTVYLLRGESQQAASDFQAVAALEPSSSLGRLGLGAAYYQLGDDQAALKTYEELMSGGVKAAERGEVAAAIAYLQCRQGLYDSALARSAEALREDPHHPLARYVRAASLLARQQIDAAAQAIGERRGAVTLCGLMVEDCLFAPPTYYAKVHQLAQVAPARLPAPEPRVGGEELLHQEPDFRIVYPRHGATVSGRLRVRLQVKGPLDVSHVSVLLGDSFVGMGNQAPFELTVMTTSSPEGWQPLRVDGYDSEGHIVRSASVGVVVANGNRTLAPQERRARATTAALLRPYLFLQPQPGLWEHLCGCIWEAQGDYLQAVASYESAFAQWPELPLLREDLLSAYQHLSIPTKSSPAEMHQLRRGSRAVALTFDDGPHPKVTPWILDHLDRVGAKATFFVVGKQVDLYPELTAEIVRRGHQLGSHSYTHRNMRKLRALEIGRELVRSRAAVRRASGVNVTLFRPPGGHYNEAVRQATGLWGYTTVFWTANICDYTGASAHQIKVALLRDIAPGGIVLLHNGEDATVDILPDLLTALKARGLKMVSLSGPESYALVPTNARNP